MPEVLCVDGWGDVDAVCIDGGTMHRRKNNVKGGRGDAEWIYGATEKQKQDLVETLVGEGEEKQKGRVAKAWEG